MLVTWHSDSMHINALLFLVVCASFIVQVGDKSWGEGGGEKKRYFPKHSSSCCIFMQDNLLNKTTVLPMD